MLLSIGSSKGLHSRVTLTTVLKFLYYWPTRVLAELFLINLLKVLHPWKRNMRKYVLFPDLEKHFILKFLSFCIPHCDLTTVIMSSRLRPLICLQPTASDDSI
uniref:Uncharacterized protein n=1 Tax=Populus trichocarpa TaxID=3694 RepID=A0A2K2BEX7_POPTR